MNFKCKLLFIEIQISVDMFPEAITLFEYFRNWVVLLIYFEHFKSKNNKKFLRSWHQTI